MVLVSSRSVQCTVAIVLIAAAAILVLWVLAMGLMPSMMAGMMGGGMMGSMSGCTISCMAGPLLLATVLVGMAVVLLRSGGGRNGDKQL